MVTHAEGTFKVEGTTLHTETWTPEGPPKAKVIFIHGYSDHIGRYRSLFDHLAGRGIVIYGLDQRGWGRSAKKSSDKGLSGPTTKVVADIAVFISDKLPSDVPLFVMGHSMGGGQVLTFASSPEYENIIEKVHGWILEAPFIGFHPAEQPSALKIYAGRLAGRVLPKFQLVNVIPPENLSRDPEVVKSIKEDTLMHNTGTLEGLAGMLDRADNLAKGKVKLSSKVQSLWLGHGTEDKACSYDASRKWFESQDLKDGEFKTYEGHYHQLHADHGKEIFEKDVGDWILARSHIDESRAGPKL